MDSLRRAARSRAYSFSGVLGRAGAICLAAALFLLPAFKNHYPFLFPDTLEYVAKGHGVLLRLLGFDMPFWSFSTERSEIYSALLSLLHPPHSLWTAVFPMAALTAWMLWLVVRSLSLRRPLAIYLVLAAFLSYFSSVGWFVSLVMPDILAGLLPLCVYLLVIANETLHRWEKFAVAVVAFFVITAHGSHFLLASAFCLFLAVLWLFRYRGMFDRGRQLLVLTGLLTFAALAQALVHARLYGKPTLFGNPPPFLMARLIEDGPARTYLQTHCNTLSWTICRHRGELSTSTDFLWSPEGVWQRATGEEQVSLRQEQTPLALATLRAYPRQQASATLDNIYILLRRSIPWEFGPCDGFSSAKLDMIFPGLGAAYAGTLQAANAIPQTFYGRVQSRVVVLAALLSALLLPLLWRRRAQRAVDLAVVALFGVLVNACITASLSCACPRYQCRVEWLVPMLAVLLFCVWSAGTPSSRTPAA